MTLQNTKRNYAQSRGIRHLSYLIDRFSYDEDSSDQIEKIVDDVAAKYAQEKLGDLRIIIADLVKPYSKEISEYIRWDNFPDKPNEIETSLDIN